MSNWFSILRCTRRERKAFQKSLKERVTEAISWAKENPNATEKFLKQWLTDAEEEEGQGQC